MVKRDLASLLLFVSVITLISAPVTAKAQARAPSTFDRIQSGAQLLARQSGGQPAISFSETDLTFKESDLVTGGYRSCNLYVSGGVAADGFSVSIETLTADELAPLRAQLSAKPKVVPTHRLTLNNSNLRAVRLSGLGSTTIYLVLKKDAYGGETLRGRGLFLLQNHDVHVYTPTRGTLFVKGLENAEAQSVQATGHLTPASAFYYLSCNLGIQ